MLIVCYICAIEFPKSMKHRIYIPIVILLLSTFSLQAQFIFGFSNEIGVGAGPVLFQSDYGLRNNFDTNINNTGVGVVLMHYMNFAYRADCNCYSRDVYFNDHFKIRNELNYHYTKLTHEGPESQKDTEKSQNLRDHTGTSSVFQVGSQVEFYPLSVRDFQAGAYRIVPYIGLGAHYVSFKPTYSSTQFSPNVPIEDVYFENFLVGDGKLGGLDDSQGHTLAVVGTLGIRYKIGVLSDLYAEARYHRYSSDWVDGLNPDRNSYPANKYNDSTVWLSLGYIYYLNF